MNINKAKDILQNDIADYIISNFCSPETCDLYDECGEKDEDCIYQQSIDKVVEELENRISISEIEDKIAEIETNPKFGKQYWYDEDVVNLLNDLIHKE